MFNCALCKDSFDGKNGVMVVRVNGFGGTVCTNCSYTRSYNKK